jgi:hypothetical protein
MTEYTCHFCGKKHTDLDKYAQCVAGCAKQQSERKAAEERKRLASRREDRRKEIDACYKKLEALMTEEYQDVGYSSSILNISRPELFFL